MTLFNENEMKSSKRFFSAFSQKMLGKSMCPTSILRYGAHRHFVVGHTEMKAVYRSISWCNYDVNVASKHEWDKMHGWDKIDAVISKKRMIKREFELIKVKNGG